VAINNRIGRVVVRYLQSTRNLVGSVLGLLGLGLYGVGLAGRFWPLVVAGLYVAGAVATPPDRAVRLGSSAPAGSPADLRARLEQLAAQIRQHGRAMPRGVLPRFEATAGLLTELLARPDELAMHPEQWYLVDSTIRLDLPASFEAYLNLPRWFTAGRLLPNGRTAADELLSQLDTINRAVTAAAAKVYDEPAQRIVQQGERLAARDGEPTDT
jgi:hypothetical protein